MASEEKVEHDCIICASVLGTNGGILTLLCGELPKHSMTPASPELACSCNS